MADAAHEEYHHGDMDISEHRSTYVRVIAVFKYGIVMIGIVLVLLALTRTHAIDCKKTDLAKEHINDCGKLPAAQAKK